MDFNRNHVSSELGFKRLFFFSCSAIGFHADSKVQDYILPTFQNLSFIYDKVCNYWVSTKELGMIYIPLFPFISLQIGERFRAPESSKSHPKSQGSDGCPKLGSPFQSPQGGQCR